MRIPEKLKPEVDRHLQEMLKIDIIRPPRSPMGRPLVCLLKGKAGCNVYDWQLITVMLTDSHGMMHIHYRIY